MKKVLILGIIVLFVSVGFQPVLANEVSITKTSDIVEDCGCQENNRVNLLRFKLFLIRLEAFTNIILLSKLGYIPEVAEKCEEILDIINSNKVLDYPIICALIFVIFSPVIALHELLGVIYDKYWRENPFIAKIILALDQPLIFLLFIMVLMLYQFDC